MAESIGYMNTPEGDLLIEGGSFKLGHTQSSEVRRLLLSRPGDFKWGPLVGCSLRDWLGAPMDGSERRRLERVVREQLGADGLTVNEFTISPTGEIKLDAER